MLATGSVFPRFQHDTYFVFEFRLVDFYKRHLFCYMTARTISRLAQYLIGLTYILFSSRISGISEERPKRAD